ncbi:MAG: asparagine synthase (glutamine-hydrolyzing) [Polyangiaceae bacterium]
MCGIVGFLHRDGRPVDDQTILAATRALAHRGPDGEGIWLDGPIALGHRRLAIRDLSDGGRQPVWDASGRIVVTYNGEIYNYDELRDELERRHGIRLRSRCDAEIIPNGYRAWGEDVFDRLEGMFAVALWDAADQRLVLARDGVGIKPLFVTEDDRSVAFASEVKALCANRALTLQVEPRALHAYLAQGYVGPDRTLLRGVEQLPPGTVRTYDRSGRRDRRFWTPTRRAEIRSLPEALEAFESIWPRVVEDMLVSDVPVGVLQSGGIDSSLVSIAARSKSETRLFTAAFHSAAHDEVAQARSVANFLGAKHDVVPIQQEVSAEATFRAVVRHLDGQLADSSAFAFYVLCREVRRHVPVVLSGDGGDEFFGGYPTYRATRIAEYARRIVPSTAADLLGRRVLPLGARSSARVSAWDVMGRFLLGMSCGAVDAHAEWRRLLPRHEMPRIYGPELARILDEDPLAGYKSALRDAGDTTVDRCLLADQRYYLPADMLMKVDAMSMAHGMEVRVPFLDRRIMDLAGRIDARLLTPWRGPDKLVLREAARRAGAPRTIVSGKKRGLNVPILHMLRGELAPMAERVLCVDGERLAPLLDPAGLRRMWTEHKEGRVNHSYALWAILSLGTWLSAVDDRPQQESLCNRETRPNGPGKTA